MSFTFSRQGPVVEWAPLPDDQHEVLALLSWRVRLAPFIGQEAELAKLVHWATEDGPAVRIRFLSGPGGSGKSRLAAELAERLGNIPETPWVAGFLRSDGTIPSGRALLVVDYPEERPQFMRTLFQGLSALPASYGPVRLLLLTRRPLEWWHAEIDAVHARHLVGRQEIAVAPLSETDAVALYAAVSKRLSEHFGLAAPEPRDAEFRNWRARNPSLHSLPLFVTAAAIYAVLGDDDALGYTGEEVILALVSRERVRLAGESRAAGFDAEGAARLAALAVVRGGFDATALRRFAQPALELGLSAPNKVVDDVRRLTWWKNNGWPAPSPDIVAAALAFEVFQARSDMAPTWIWAALEGTGREIIGRLGRLVYDMGTIYGPKRQEFSDWLVAMVRDEPARSIPLRFFNKEDRLPVGVSRIAVAVGQALLTTRMPSDERAEVLHNLSADLYSLGQRGAALAVIREAIAIRRKLVPRKPAAFKAELARSLKSLSILLSTRRARKGAQKAAEESVTIYRTLTTARIGKRFDAGLASSLNTLAVRYAEGGDETAALAPIREAVEIRRRLIQRDGSVDARADLAQSLNNLSVMISNAGGDAAESRKAMQDAAAIYRELSQQQPELFEPDLADALNNLSVRLADDDEKTKALIVIEEAVAIYRRLAEAHPTRFESDLAMSLDNRGKRLNDMEQFVPALQSMRDSVTIYRQLAGTDPARFESDLALGLNNLADSLMKCERYGEAFVQARDAVDIFERLPRAKQEHFEANLADTLEVLAPKLAGLGETSDAKVAIEAAVTIYRRLAAKDPKQFAELLAKAEKTSQAL